jgi:hypothetical protein
VGISVVDRTCLKCSQTKSTSKMLAQTSLVLPSTL